MKIEEWFVFVTVHERPPSQLYRIAQDAGAGRLRTSSESLSLGGGVFRTAQISRGYLSHDGSGAACRARP
jgi:hypothetical protein